MTDIEQLRRQRIDCLAEYLAQHDDAIMSVCRDIPGRHVGGPGCWCDPHIIECDDRRSADAIIAEIERAERVN